MDQIQHSKSRQQQIDTMLSNYEGERIQQHQEETKDELVKIRQRVNLMMEVYNNDDENTSEMSQIKFFNNLEELRRLFDSKQVKNDFHHQFQVFVIGLQSGFEKKHNILHSLCESLQQLQNKFALDTIHSYHSDAILNGYSINGALSTLHRSIERLDGIKSAMRRVFEIQSSKVDKITNENVEESLDIAEEEMMSISNYLNQTRDHISVFNNKIQSLQSKVEKRDQEIDLLKILLLRVKEIPSVSIHLDEQTSESINHLVHKPIIEQGNHKDLPSLSISEITSAETSKSRNAQLSDYSSSITNQVDLLPIQHTSRPNTEIIQTLSNACESFRTQLVEPSNLVNGSEIQGLKKQNFHRQYVQEIDVSHPRSESSSSHLSLMDPLLITKDPLPLIQIGDDVANGDRNTIKYQASAHQHINASPTALNHSFPEHVQHSQTSDHSSDVNLNHDGIESENSLMQQVLSESINNSQIHFKCSEIRISPPCLMQGDSKQILDTETADLSVGLKSNHHDSALREQLYALQQLRLQESRDSKRRIHSLQMQIEKMSLINKTQSISTDFSSSHLLECKPVPFCKDEGFIQRYTTDNEVNHSLRISELIDLIIEIHNVFIDLVTQSNPGNADSLQPLKFSSSQMNVGNMLINLKRSLAILTGMFDTKVRNDSTVESSLPMVQTSFVHFFDTYFSDLRFQDLFQIIECSFQKSSYNDELRKENEVSFFTKFDIAKNAKILDKCENVGLLCSSKKIFLIALSTFYTKLTHLRWHLFQKYLVKLNDLTLGSFCEDSHLRVILSKELSRFKKNQQNILHEVLLRRSYIANQLTKELFLLENSTGEYFIKPIYSHIINKKEIPPVLQISSLSSNKFQSLSNTKALSENSNKCTTSVIQPNPSSPFRELALFGAHITRPISATIWHPNTAINQNI